jgi:hypothetical protein
MSNYFYDDRQPPNRTGPPSGSFDAYRPPQRTPPPPNRLSGRGRQAWSGLGGLTLRARFDSMVWWRLKALHGCMSSAGLVFVGLILWFISALSSHLDFLFILGGLLLGLAFLVLIRYLAAPWTCRWIVTVPENWYYVVEDQYQYTVDYLEPGRMLVPWRWNAKVYRYVDFNIISVTQVVENVLRSGTLPVNLEVQVTMAFNPSYADPENFAMLRRMTSPEPFQRMLAHDVRDIVLKHLGTFETLEGSMAQSLEALIADQLQARIDMGLKPARERPVRVYAHVPQAVREVYQSLPGRSSRLDEESQMLMDVKDLSQRLGVPQEDAFLLAYLLKRGSPPEPSPTTPPVSEPLPIQPRGTGTGFFRRRQPGPSAHARKTDEHPAVEPPTHADQPAHPWPSGEWDDFDPMDARRRRKDQGR